MPCSSRFLYCFRRVPRSAWAAVVAGPGHGAPHLAPVCRAGDDESKTGSAVDETVDRSVVMYNYAVALYHMRQFESAHRLLDSLVGSVLTPVDEHLAMRASFLMLDMYATGYRGAVQSDQDVSAVYESAMRLVAWLEEPHSFNGGAGGAGGDRSGSKDTDQVVSGLGSLSWCASSPSTSCVGGTPVFVACPCRPTSAFGCTLPRRAWSCWWATKRRARRS